MNDLASDLNQSISDGELSEFSVPLTLYALPQSSVGQQTRRFRSASELNAERKIQGKTYSLGDGLVL